MQLKTSAVKNLEADWSVAFHTSSWILDMHNAYTEDAEME